MLTDEKFCKGLPPAEKRGKEMSSALFSAKYPEAYG